MPGPRRVSSALLEQDRAGLEAELERPHLVRQLADRDVEVEQ